MFLGHQDQNIIGGKKKKPKYDNYSMKTYIFRDIESNAGNEKSATDRGVAGDLWNILILLLLYTIQGLLTDLFRLAAVHTDHVSLTGIPLGLGGSVPVLMKERGASYSSLSLFSMVSVPFSIKLIWAPIIDSIYLKSVGRRKTWLV